MNDQDSKDLEMSVLPIEVLEPQTPGSASAKLSVLFYNLFPAVIPRGMRDDSYFEALLQDFGSDFDIDEEMKRFHAWTLDRPQGPANSPRSRFRDWMLRTRTYRLRRSNS